MLATAGSMITIYTSRGGFRQALPAPQTTVFTPGGTGTGGGGGGGGGGNGNGHGGGKPTKPPGRG